MTDDAELRDGFRFRGGSVPLDFTATLTGRLRETQRELLAEPADLARWFVAAGLATTRIEVTPHLLARARELREAIYRLASARARGERLRDADRATLNRWSAGATPAPILERNGMTWTSGTSRTLLAAIARAAVELLGGPLSERIRQCSGPGCAILFADTSRSGHRKWCSMLACGNKAKVASFRERNREE